MMEDGLKGMSALVTGGGRGLGFAICEALAEAGVHVAVADIQLAYAAKTAETLRRLGVASEAIEADIGDERQASNAVSRAVERFGGLDILVNNAGVDVTVPIEDMSVEDWDRILRVNLRGAFLMSKYAFTVMKGRGSGSIVNIASTAAKRAWANASAYHASKWGLLGFSHALHVEARAANVRVFAVVSGGMRTPFLLDRFPGIDVSTLQDPRTVARTVRFMLSLPQESVIPEVMVIPMRETSWP